MENHSYYKSKRANPRENANPLSVFTFFYTFSTFFYGYRKNITEDDIYETFSTHKSSNLGTTAIALWNKEIERASKLKIKPSLRKLLFELLFRDYLLICVSIGFCELIVKPLQAYFLGELIFCYSEPEVKRKPSVYALGIVTCVLINILLIHPAILLSYHLALKVRIICSSLIYRKVLRLSKSALDQTTTGQILNLISADVNVFEKGIFTSLFLWIGPIQAIIFVTLMYMEIGIPSFFGTFILLIFIPLYFLMGRMTSKYRLKASMERDQRLRFMNEVIQGINVIKMYAWENSFSKIISAFRKLEIYFIKLGLYIKSVYLSYSFFSTTALFLTITSATLMNQNLTAKSVFMLTTLLNMCSSTLNFLLPQAMIFLSEIFVSINRITTFLLCDETDSIPSSPLCNPAISINNGSTAWDKSNSQNVLSRLNFEIESSEITAIIGSVGSGKTSLLNFILGEMTLLTGDLKINGTISYASQEPWIFSSTVRQNILFGREMCEIRYNDVIRCCALERDIKLLPYGDKTSIGEKGTSLSGGQKARINLARAIYRDADIYLLDDPLSAVDSRVGKQIFEQCIQTFLKGKTIVLVTHQLHYLKHVKHIMVLDKGEVIAKGTRSELEKSGVDFAKYLEQNEAENLNPLDREDFGSQLLHVSEEQTELAGEVTDGTKFISYDTYKDYFFASRSYMLLMLTVLFFVLAQCSVSISYYFLAYWVNMEQTAEPSNLRDKRNVYIYTYCGIIMVLVSCTIARSFYFVKLAMTSSIVLHDKMFKNVVHATIRFFNTNSSGIILNRFTKDLGTIDEMLPNAVMIAVRTVLSILGIFGVICFVNPWFLIPTTLTIVTLFYLRSFYLTTNLNILRVEGRVRGPLYGHVNASLQGLSTIRASNNQEILTDEFYHHQDTHTSALQMALTTSRAFAYWLDLISVLYIAVLNTYYIFNADTYGGNIGLIISQALQLINQLPWGVRQITDVENFMISVERILEYDSIEKERNLEITENKTILPSWPSNGKIEFQNVCLRYVQEGPYALKDVSFIIRPGEKIGVVGRTGAGKSSIISAIFQLIETEGFITIDGVNIQGLKLHNLRKKMSIIPQDPVLFSGTIRYNLDPFNEYDDETLWKALEEVRLKDVVASIPTGLNFEVSQDGGNFSVGQRQLICLARAIVKDNKILLLDEATANVDLNTDTIIQEALRTKFSNCTVLTIAHRLNTVIDSDKILVMDGGVAVEFDHPHLLLQNEKSFFYSLVQQTDNVMAQTLIQSAALVYKGRERIQKD